MNQRINYLIQLNSLFRMLEAENLSASALALYVHLLDINNRCEWQEWIDGSISALCRKTGLSPHTVLRSRDALVKRGLIAIDSRPGNVTKVSIIPLTYAKNAQVDGITYAENAQVTDSTYAKNAQVSASTYAEIAQVNDPTYAKNAQAYAKIAQVEGSTYAKIAHNINIYKEDKEEDIKEGQKVKDLPKTEITDVGIKAVSMWEKKFGVVSPSMALKLQDLLEEVGETNFKEALEIAEDHNARSYRYLQTTARNLKGGVRFGTRENRRTGDKGSNGSIPQEKSAGRFDFLLNPPRKRPIPPTETD